MSDEYLQKDDGTGGSNRQVMIFAMAGIVLTGVCALLFLAYQWIQSGDSSLIAQYFPSPTPTRVPTSTAVPTRTPVPDLTATQAAWVKPAQSPTMASASDAQSAYDAGGSYLEAYAWTFPDTPDVNQPGDVYTYEVQLTESVPLLWSYGWCTTTEAILEDNYRYIQLEFVLNETVIPLSNFIAVDYARDDGSPCREYVGLVETWTTGQHQLETRITFTQDIHDGWDLYSAGTHVFKYLVTVQP